NSAHGTQHRVAAGLIERRQGCPHLLLRAPVKRSKYLLAVRGQPQMLATRVLRGGLPRNQLTGLESLEDAAQVALVDAEFLRQLARGDTGAVSYLVHHPYFRQGIRAIEQTRAQHADPARVITVEGADACDLLGGDGHVDSLWRVMPARGACSRRTEG